MKEKRQVPAGIFPGSAFLDRVRISLSEKVQPQLCPLLTEQTNKACGGEGSRYGRCSEGFFNRTGNRYRLNYSKLTLLPNVPEALLWVDSERIPVTVAEACQVSRCLTGKMPRFTYVELAWDFYGSFDDFARQIVSRSTRKRLLLVDHKTGQRTLYLGSRRGERQVCLYDKAPGVVRLEIRLRLGGLKRLGINSPKQLVLLKDVDFSRLVSICELRVPAVVREKWRRKLWEYFAERQSLDVLMREFAQYHRVPRKQLLRPTPLDMHIRDMQRKLTC
jgi:hypothetical protein